MILEAGDEGFIKVNNRLFERVASRASFGISAIGPYASMKSGRRKIALIIVGNRLTHTSANTHELCQTSVSVRPKQSLILCLIA